MKTIHAIYETDQWHALATPVFMELLATHRDMMTTTSVLFECGNAAARRTYRQDVVDLREMLDLRLAAHTIEENR